MRSCAIIWFHFSNDNLSFHPAPAVRRPVKRQASVGLRSIMNVFAFWIWNAKPGTTLSMKGLLFIGFGTRLGRSFTLDTCEYFDLSLLILSIAACNASCLPAK